MNAAVELRLEGSAELGYDPLGSPPKGEICLRGPMVFAGYYKDPEKTKEAFGARPRGPIDCAFHTRQFSAVMRRAGFCLFTWSAHLVPRIRQ